jgi:hypothetical protein
MQCILFLAIFTPWRHGKQWNFVSFSVNSKTNTQKWEKSPTFQKHKFERKTPSLVSWLV